MSDPYYSGTCNFCQRMAFWIYRTSWGDEHYVCKRNPKCRRSVLLMLGCAWTRRRVDQKFIGRKQPELGEGFC